MNSKLLWTVVILALAGAGAIFYNRWQANPPAPPVTPMATTELQPLPEPRTEAEILYPVAASGTELKPLPALGDSDGAAQEAIAGLAGAKSFMDLFYPGGIIRRVVATVDNLPREKLALRLMPVKPVAGKFVTAGEGESLAIGPDNSARYAPYVKLVEAADAKKLVAAYVRFYPLFQQAYKDLGYPKAYFNDRLVTVIDHLLVAPEVPGVLKLTQPKVAYQFADPKLESLSAGQKIIVRMGGENAARMKAKLREIRAELVSQAPRQ